MARKQDVNSLIVPSVTKQGKVSVILKAVLGLCAPPCYSKADSRGFGFELFKGLSVLLKILEIIGLLLCSIGNCLPLE